MTNRHRVSLFAAAGAAVFLLAAPAAQASCMGMAKGESAHDQTAGLQTDQSVQTQAFQTPAPRAAGDDALRRDEDALVEPVEITGAERTASDAM
ncbi:MAG: hypothetical protein RIB45_07250 [Marivibrio sp.]|uniref:hypothetical protein n=1 Tax=Marivibrio sp. TaxID=2039719 RepID=UPI0032EC87A2